MNLLNKVVALALENAPDALMIGGAGAVSYGAGLICLPAGWIVAGLFAIGGGLVWAGSRK